MKKASAQNNLIRTIKKYLLSIFVVLTFIAYALDNRKPAPVVAAERPAAAATATAEATAIPGAPPNPPAATSAPAATASSGLKDGTYTGSQVDVQCGYVQVQATIQGGKINDVQFLQYPTDRRTSVRINSFAVPALQQEAIHAQSANVDIVTGATLTSEGFQQSLQDALSQAQG